MQTQTTTATFVIAAVSVLVLLLGKGLPKLFEMVDHEGLVLAGYLLVTTGWLVVLSMVPGANLSALLGEWRSSWLLWGLLFGLGLFVVSGVGYAVSARMGFSPPDEASLVSKFQGASLVMLLFVVVVLAVIEEWLFRGVILGYFGSQSAVLAVIGSAAVFALYHLSVFQLLPTFLLGLGLAVIFVYFGALWPAVLAHIVFNGLGIMISAYSGPS